MVYPWDNYATSIRAQCSIYQRQCEHTYRVLLNFESHCGEKSMVQCYAIQV